MYMEPAAASMLANPSNVQIRLTLTQSQALANTNEDRKRSQLVVPFLISRPERLTLPAMNMPMLPFGEKH